MAGIKITDLPAAPLAQLTDVFPIDQLPGPITYKESNSQLLTLFKANGEALTRINDTNVTMTLGGNPATALFNAASMTLGWTGQLSVPRGGTGNSTFTAFSVICAGTSATGGFQNVVGLGNAGEQLTSNGAGLLPTWQPSSTVTPAALTKVDDTNVTLTLGGTPTTALLQATSITVGWAGQLSETRGGTAQSTYTLGDILYSSAANTLTKLPGNITAVKQYLSQTGNGTVSAPPAWSTIDGADITGAALTKVDDTNVTLTLGGTPTTALLRASSLTLGWAGQLSLARGGTNKSITPDNGALVYCDADSFELLAATATAGQIPRSGANAAPTWSTATYPAAAGTSGNVLTSDGTNWNSTAPAALSPLTTKGDLYTFTTVNARLAVGTTNGQMLQVNSGAATGLAWSTATYPATATNVARLLRSDATNWVETTSTFADTYAASTILYANGANNVAGLATANNGILLTSGTGVPSIGNTVGAGLTMPSITFNTTTGVVGTTTNNDAAAGSVGEIIASQITSGAPTSVATATLTNLTSISLTAGDWDVEANVHFDGNASVNPGSYQWGISTTTVTLPDPSFQGRMNATPATVVRVGGPPSALRLSLSGTTTVYLVVTCAFTSGTMNVSGVLQARRRR